jgi:GNAT superfamily N-acetyltransferase
MIPGSFYFRPAKREDAESLAEVLNACAIERTGKPATTTERIEHAMSTPGLDLERNTHLAVDMRKSILGFAMILNNQDYTQFNAEVEVHPKFRAQGIGTVLRVWLEACVRRSMTEAPSGARILLLQKRLSTDESACDLLSGAGYQIVRHDYRMLIEMDAPPKEFLPPEGIDIRPFDRDREDRALVEALREAFRENWGYVERPFEEEYQRWMHLLDNSDPDPSAYWLVAVDEEEIAGVCVSIPSIPGDPEMAWINALGVRRTWRQRGIALALLEHAFCTLYESGQKKVVLNVDAQSTTGTTHLYEKAGMHVEWRYDYFERVLRQGEGD